MAIAIIVVRAGNRYFVYRDEESIREEFAVGVPKKYYTTISLRQGNRGK
jgi:hypothetical protein